MLERTHSHDNDLSRYLSVMVQHGASDLFLSSGTPAGIKVQGALRRLDEPALDGSMTQALAYSIMRESQIKSFEATLECDFAIALPGLGRFRVNVFRQRGEVAVVVRHINARIPSIDNLKLPPVLKQLCQLKRGLVLMVGAAGSGKSTTLAAMIDHRNRIVGGHILTVEDPMEFEHSHGVAIVDQREVGLDTRSFDEALRHAMREAPDVIMIGEIRDRDTMQHANNTNQAIQRILNFFPEAAHRQVLMDLSLNLKGVVGQRLLRNSAGQLVPAVEVMLLSPYISELIQKGQTDDIKDAIAKSNELGMMTFDQSLYDLYLRGEISAEQAIDYADSRTDVSLRIRLHTGQRPDTTGLGIQR